MFDNIYKGKKVLVTGHTGFKGSWLTTWLLSLGAQVVGISKDIPTTPSLFEELKLDGQIKEYRQDIRDQSEMVRIVSLEQPDFLFHLAAQPIVSVSYQAPIDTITSNVIGTANILESLRVLNRNCTAVIITSDKAYDNVEQVWGYRENDRMGGKDVYSGSKGAAELVFKSYFHSFFKSDASKVRLCVGRAGNVIGGGDWAKDRLVADCMRAWSVGKAVTIRSPGATRPWQHVLEPLSGYLCLAWQLNASQHLHGEAFNFGPNADQNHNVEELLLGLAKHWDFNEPSEAYRCVADTHFSESTLLKLSCDKALAYLDWLPTLSYENTVAFTSQWYYEYYTNKVDMLEYTLKQINQYTAIAREKGMKWTG